MRYDEIEMSTKVKKEELLEILKKNRANHRKIFEEALEGYKKKMIALLLKMLKDVRKGKRVSHMISMPLPQNMTAEYDTVIRMLEMSTDNEVKLSAKDFQCFVEDRWEWRDNFIHSNAAYSMTAMTLAAKAEKDGEEDE